MVTASLNRAGAADAQLVEAFATVAAHHLGETCVVAMLLPWSNGTPPLGVLVPTADDSLLSSQEVQEAVRTRQVILVPCTFNNQREEIAAREILPQFANFEHVCLMMAHLIPADLQLDREMNDTIMRRHDAMIANGADDVLMDPGVEPNSLRRNINIAKAVWELNLRRMQLMLDAEPELVSPHELAKLQQHHRRLLWESTPRALMPHFCALDKHLVETGQTVGRFRLVKKVETVGGLVLHALDDNGQSCAIKVLNKSKVFTPGDLEGIYREYRFLSEIIRHPNIVRCLTMMQSTCRVYLVFEFAGSLNLAQVLSNQPGQRFDEADTLTAFDQLVQALSYCHSKDVAHRNVSLEHIIVNGLEGTVTSHCQLCDFRSAMVARGHTTSKTSCGTLPCMAPEIALGTPYIPRHSDCWSAGIVLLESAGGLSTLSRTVPYDAGNVEPNMVAGAIQHFFSEVGSHSAALCNNGGVRSAAIQPQLEALLKPIPDERGTMQEIAAAAAALR